MNTEDYIKLANEAFGKVVDYDLLGNPITDYDVLLMGAYGPAIRRLIALATKEAGREARRMETEMCAVDAISYGHTEFAEYLMEFSKLREDKG